jgi:hypothetical protein
MARGLACLDAGAFPYVAAPGLGGSLLLQGSSGWMQQPRRASPTRSKRSDVRGCVIDGPPLIAGALSAGSLADNAPDANQRAHELLAGGSKIANSALGHERHLRDVFLRASSDESGAAMSVAGTAQVLGRGCRTQEIGPGFGLDGLGCDLGLGRAWKAMIVHGIARRAGCRSSRGGRRSRCVAAVGGVAAVWLTLAAVASAFAPVTGSPFATGS